jgi:hypothetical protein
MAVEEVRQGPRSLVVPLNKVLWWHQHMHRIALTIDVGVVFRAGLNFRYDVSCCRVSQ